MKGYTQIVALLIAHKANLDRADNQGKTPAYHAVFHNRPQVLTALLEAGVNVDQPVMEGTLLHVAALRGHLSVARLLIQNGGQLEAKDPAGHRPLDVAINRGHSSVTNLITKELIKRKEKGL